MKRSLGHAKQLYALGVDMLAGASLASVEVTVTPFEKFGRVRDKETDSSICRVASASKNNV